MKDNFLLKRSQINVFNELSNEDAGKLIKGIYEYVQNRKITLTGYLKVIFIPIKEEIDKNEEKYELICERNRNNGKLGGRPKKPKETENNPLGFLETQKNMIYHIPTHNNINSKIIDSKLEDSKAVNSKYSSKIINSNNNSNNIFSYIEENFGRLLTPIEYQEISTWEDNELTRYAIKDAVLNGKYNIKYISRILESYKKNSIITIQQAQEETRKFKEKNKYKSSSDKTKEVFERFLAKGES